MYILKDAHITALSQIVHIKMVYIRQFISPLLLDAQVLWNHDPDIIIALIKTLRKRTDNVCQASGFNKRNCLRSNK